MTVGVRLADVVDTAGGAGVTVYILEIAHPVLMTANGEPPEPTMSTDALQFQFVKLTGVPSVQRHEDSVMLYHKPIQAPPLDQQPHPLGHPPCVLQYCC